MTADRGTRITLLVATTTKLKDVPLGTRCTVIHDSGELLILRPLDQASWIWAKRSEVSESFQLTLDDRLTLV